MHRSRDFGDLTELEQVLDPGVLDQKQAAVSLEPVHLLPQQVAVSLLLLGRSGRLPEATCADRDILDLSLLKDGVRLSCEIQRMSNDFSILSAMLSVSV